MLKVGITGGIGSGKSWVSHMFGVLGVPVFDADDAAKYLMEQHPPLQQALIEAFGHEIYKNGRLNRPFLASLVFNQADQLARLNSLVHPEVRAYGQQWMDKQTTPYCLKEAALFFESESDRDMDKMIGVFAPKALRLQRAMHRDHASAEAISQRMDNQMDEEEKMARCDFIIYNNETHSIIQQVLQLHHQLLRIAS